jgi:pyruvate/2-oxoglutarate dehydrogenase complex dihydrolipoamide dehydrogenase (E3) component
MNHYDAIIIGTGQAGPSLAARFAAAGKAVAIVERHKFGGTCVNTGCIPTKTLVASAYAAHVAHRGAEYGFAVTGDVRVDMKRVKARKDAVSQRSNKGVTNVGTVLPLEEARIAHEMLDGAPHMRGKIVLRIAA